MHRRERSDICKPSSQLDTVKLTPIDRTFKFSHQDSGWECNSGVPGEGHRQTSNATNPSPCKIILLGIGFKLITCTISQTISYLLSSFYFYRDNWYSLLPIAQYITVDYCLVAIAYWNTQWKIVFIEWYWPVQFLGALNALCNPLSSHLCLCNSTPCC